MIKSFPILQTRQYTATEDFICKHEALHLIVAIANFSMKLLKTKKKNKPYTVVALGGGGCSLLVLKKRGNACRFRGGWYSKGPTWGYFKWTEQIS